MTILQDFRYAFRAVQKSPVFASVVVATLALCIGANTAIFSVVDAALFRPLPYPDPDRLAQIGLLIHSPRGESTRLSHDGRTWELLRDRTRRVNLAVYSNSSTDVNFAYQGTPGLLRQQRVSARFFNVLGVDPIAGRAFSDDEDRPGGPAVAILSYRLWKRLWQENPDVIGESILLRGQPHTVVGIMPSEFRSSIEADVWTPLRATASGEGSGSNFQILGRLQDGMSWEQAAQELDTLGAALAQELNTPSDVDIRLAMVGLHHGLAQTVQAPLTMLWGAVGAVLFIGCVNISGLLLARGASRSREIGIRLAMGARARAIIRQLLTESLVYASLGGIAGVAVARLWIHVLKKLGEESLPFLGAISIDARVALATAGLSLLACLVFGVFPALQATRIDVQSALGGASRVAGPTTHRSLRLMVLAQVALAVPLLIAAVLLVRTFVYLWRLTPGFDASNVMTTTVSLQDARYETAKQVNQLVQETLSRLEALPGVELAAAALSLPYERGLNMPFSLVGGEDERHGTSLTYVTADYFHALRIPLIRGRTFTGADTFDGARAVVVTQAFVHRYLQNKEPLATELRFGMETGVREGSWRIVGVVGDVQQRPSWGTAAPLAPLPAAYIPLAQTGDGFLEVVHTWFSPSFILKTAGPMPHLPLSVQEALASVDPLLPVAAFRTLSDVKSQSLALHRYLMTLLSAFAVLAALLASLGIYGMGANIIAQRGGELCVRMVIGATVFQAMATAVLPGLGVVSAGAMVGLALSVISARMIQHLIWGVETTDPATLGGVVLGAVLFGALASLIPAARLLTVSPAQKLRNE